MDKIFVLQTTFTYYNETFALFAGLARLDIDDALRSWHVIDGCCQASLKKSLPYYQNNMHTTL